MDSPCSSDNFDQEHCYRQLAIVWIGLKYCVKTGFTRKTKTILNDINGSIDFGTISAIMGPSGAGKTTLLKCISGRQTKGIDRKTKIYVNKDIEIKCCLIVQEVKEHLLNGLTTLQSIIYSSKLKNLIKGFDHELNARNLLMSLNITNTANTCVDECSGGEQKRIVIALELSAENKPNLLCIDEPTSGLDSCAATEVIQCLKDLSVNNGISVVTSIHQPNHEIISQFDKLYEMSVGGQCVYDGHPKHMKRYLESVGILLITEEPPIEIIIKMSSRIQYHVTTRMIDVVRSKSKELEQRCLNEGLLLHGVQKTIVSFSWTQMWYLTQRAIIHNIRYRKWSDISHFIIVILLALTFPYTFVTDIGQPLGCIDPLHPPGCNQSAQDLIDENLITQNTALTFIITNVLLILFPVLWSMTFTSEMSIFFKEHSNGWYSSTSYYLAKTLAELPMALALVFIYGLILYKGSHQIDEAFRLWSFIGVLVLEALTAQGYGLTISIVSNSNEDLAYLISLAFFLLYGFCDPFLTWGWNESLDWLRYLAYSTQADQCQLYLIYGFNRCPSGLSPRALWYYGIDDRDKFYINIYILIFHLILIRVAGLVLLVFKAKMT